MLPGILGKRVDMGQFFREDGRVEPVTAIQAGPCIITQVKVPAKDGYAAVQIGFEDVPHLNKPEAGHLKRAGSLFRYLREVRVEELGDLQVGQRVDVSIFQPGDRVDIIGTSKGKGFAGVVKRHHFRGGPKTHGQSDRLRAPGSIGSTTFPGRVFKGLRMAGHMGNERITVRNLEVIKCDLDRNILLVKGAVPGPRNGLVLIRKARVAGKKVAGK